ncbi:hypothetical protein [Nonomuraea sediminis]|uniref:hypothetical protein n=1 Tax=Nonomuraea sediminis TaxID=2835864 RepID=UPI001BDD424C|nr:hypothetical protein [Nonomuraea sediminis]
MMSFAAVLQILIALAFVSIPVVRHRYGPQAKAAAEGELRRQGIPVTVLEENKIRFDAGGHETAVPATVAVVMVTLAVLNLAGAGLGVTLSWVFQPIVLLGNLLIIYSNLTAVKSVETAFRRKNDPVLARIDVRAFLKAAERGFPTWVMPGLQNVRHVVVLGGSLLVLAMLALSA